MSVSSQASQQPEQSPAVLAIAQSIRQLAEAQFSGSLNCDSPHMVRSQLFFVAGRLVWAGGGAHRLRRWRRLLKQICPEAIFALAQLTPEVATPTWEYEALRGLLKQAHISRAQARTLITQQVSEVLFDTIQSWTLAGSYEAQVEEQFRIKDAITLIPTQDILPKVLEQWQRWNDAGMGAYSPNLSPLLDEPEQLQAQVSVSTFTKLRQMLRGQHSLRELASLMGQDVAKLAQALCVYEQQRLLQMCNTPDMSGSIPTPSSLSAERAMLESSSLNSDSTPGKTPSLPELAVSSLSLSGPLNLVDEATNGETAEQMEAVEKPAAGRSRSRLASETLPRERPIHGKSGESLSLSTESSATTPEGDGPTAGVSQSGISANGIVVSSTAPLIICIDDDELVRERIGLILMQQGYQYRGIANPVEALSTVLELRPSLVIVDLVMPQMSGYDVCGRIRRANSLQDVPLVILTGNDTILDRMRGKLVGATAYLTKPISPQAILAVVSQQLEAKAS